MLGKKDKMLELGLDCAVCYKVDVKEVVFLKQRERPKKTKFPKRMYGI